MSVKKFWNSCTFGHRSPREILLAMEIEGLTLSDDEIESKEIDEMIQSMRDKRLKDDAAHRNKMDARYLEMANRYSGLPGHSKLKICEIPLAEFSSSFVDINLESLEVGLRRRNKFK